MPDTRRTVVALVPAAGSGTRLGANKPKALVGVRGEPLLVHAVRRLLAAGCVDHVVIAAPADRVAEFAALVPDATVVAGGADRSESVRLALAAAPVCDVILVHDAARAFTPAETIRAVVAAVLAGAPAVIPVLPVADTVKTVDDGGMITGTPPRAALRAVQTPQGFAADVLRKAHGSGTSATDDATLVEQLGIPVHTVPGHPHAMKVTTPFDLAIAEAVLACE